MILHHYCDIFFLSIDEKYNYPTIYSEEALVPRAAYVSIWKMVAKWHHVSTKYNKYNECNTADLFAAYK